MPPSTVAVSTISVVSASAWRVPPVLWISVSVVNVPPDSSIVPELVIDVPLAKSPPPASVRYPELLRTLVPENSALPPTEIEPAARLVSFESAPSVSVVAIVNELLLITSGAVWPAVVSKSFIVSELAYAAASIVTG